MSDWQPISTAPKRGDHHQYGPMLLLYYPPLDQRTGRSEGGAVNYGGVIEGQWFQRCEDADEWDCGWETCIGFIGEPTHWMPHPGEPVLLCTEETKS